MFHLTSFSNGNILQNYNTVSQPEFDLDGVKIQNTSVITGILLFPFYSHTSFPSDPTLSLTPNLLPN